MLNMVIEVFSGLGMFLFGMFYMEIALKELAGIRFKKWIKNSTSTRSKSLLTGALATAVLQSSSVVTLMTLSFVSTSLVPLESAIGIIFGSNLGTTVTAWIVATLGFKVKIELFALPMIGLGGFMLILNSSHKKIEAVAKTLIGFGLLFFGLEIMKNSIETLGQNFDLASYTHYPPIAFIGLGFIITALIQSSSATTAIILSALYANILTFEQSAAMVIGANIGTTVTALLGAIGGIPDKKRVAMAHLLFNFITAFFAFLLLPYLSTFLMQTLSLHSDKTTALALFHTIFNLFGILLLIYFIPAMTKYLQLMFKTNEKLPTRYIHLADPKFPDTALVALRNEISHLFVKTLKFGLLLTHIRPDDVLNGKYDVKDTISNNQKFIDFDYKKVYENLKDIEIGTVEFANILNQQNLTPEQSQNIDILLTSAREIGYAAKTLKDIKNNIDDLFDNDNISLHNMYNEIRSNLVYIILVFVNYMNEKWPLEKTLAKFTTADEESRQITKKTTQLVSKDNVNEKYMLALLNINRNINISMKSLLEASKAVNLYFEIEKKNGKTEQ
ncbi:Na/Pi symporter [Sulfurimonas sp. HSL-1716]|uniref:Na/Pi cotransporter family protein n=1 Tax=Hydrocurvibacter sulfurireducens TaxID=3131937 RepID=UPI0031F90C1D